MRNAELEAVIRANPDDPAGYLVYADWLQAQGDPRGELIVITERGSFDEKMSFIEKHEELFLGPFARRRPAECEITWRHGFIQSAALGWGYGDDTYAEDFDAFLGLESCAFIEKLVLGPLPGDARDEDNDMRLGNLSPPIEKHAPPCLRSLYLGSIGHWDMSMTGTRMPNSESIRGLHELTLRGGDVSIDAIDLPELRSFAVETGSLTSHELEAIAKANWPNIERLEIWFGDPNYGADWNLEDIARVLAGTGMPKLRHLGLMNACVTDGIVERLIDAPVLAQLASLDLSMGTLTDAGLGAMLAAKHKLSHLEHLNLDDNALTNKHWPAARELAKNVMFGTTHDPDRAEGRFCSVGE